MASRPITIIVLIALLVVALIGGFSFGRRVGGPITTTTIVTTTTYTSTVEYLRSTTIISTYTTVTYVPTTTVKTMYITTPITITTTAQVPITITKTVTHTATITYTTTAPQEGVYVFPLVDRDYLSALLKYIDKAATSIYVIMYVVKYDPYEHDDPVNQILNALVRAHQRGVDVKVVVDDETYESYRQTIEFLKSHGIPVKLDESASVRTHAKLIIIDGRVVFIGSHNWTESALSYNHETSVLIESKELAKKLKEYFQNIWNNGRVV